MDEWHLNASRARSLVDLGCGTGKVCMQAFLEHQSLQDLFGVEISKPRYDIAEAAFLRLAAHFPGEFTVLAYHEGRSITIGTPVDSASIHGHSRLDAAGLLRSLTGESTLASSDDSAGSVDVPTSHGAGELRHPGDRSPQLDGRRGSDDDDLSPSTCREPTSIHIPPNLASATTGSTGGSSMSRSGGLHSSAPSALEKAPPVQRRQPSTCFPNSHCAVEYNPSAWRTARIAWGDMFDTCHVDTADLICIETDVPGACYPLLAAVIRSAKKGARVLSYLNLAEMWPQEMRRFFNLEQLTINRSMYDRFWTSWSYVNGHKFYLWQCMRSPLPLQVDVKRHLDGTTHVLVTVPPSVSAIRGGPLIRRVGSGFASSIADRASWKVLLSPPEWTWEDVCEVHGAGRRPRLLVFGGLLNNYGGHIEAHEDDPITFSCLMPGAPALLPATSAIPDVPQEEDCTLQSDASVHEVSTVDTGPTSQASTGSILHDDESVQSSRSASAASGDCENPVLAYAVSSVQDLDEAGQAPAQSSTRHGRQTQSSSSSKSMRTTQSEMWHDEFVLPGTPDANGHPASGFQTRPQRTVHVQR